jgi:hypothetical protein
MMTRHLAPLADHASSTPGKDGLNLSGSCRICVSGSNNRVSFANLMTPSKGYVVSCVFCRNVNGRLVCDRQAPQSHEGERRPLYSNYSGYKMVIVRPVFLIFRNFANGGMVRFQDVHDSVVINQLAKALKVAEELLFFLVVTLLIDVAHYDECTGVEYARNLFGGDISLADAALVLIHKVFSSKVR